MPTVRGFGATVPVGECRRRRESGRDRYRAVLADLLRGVVTRRFTAAEPADPMQAAVQREVQRVAVQRLRALAETAPSLEVRAEAESALRRLADELRTPVGHPRHRMLLRQEIERYLARPYPNAKPTVPDAVPQGPPIG